MVIVHCRAHLENQYLFRVYPTRTETFCSFTAVTTTRVGIPPADKDYLLNKLEMRQPKQLYLTASTRKQNQNACILVLCIRINDQFGFFGIISESPLSRKTCRGRLGARTLMRKKRCDVRANRYREGGERGVGDVSCCER